MTISPYSDKPQSFWPAITRSLVDAHPLRPDLLLEAALASWDLLWRTTVGARPSAVRLSDLRVPATVVGYFFEVLLTRELERREPTLWRGNQSGEEKDLVHLPDPYFSVEVKTSGQAGFKVYGNRSYGQAVEDAHASKKERSGYYVTVNFYGRALTLIRFGWIDAEDWIPQKSATGQMAGLGPAVYQGKLIVVPGPYRLRSPVLLLRGVGPVTVAKFAALGITTFDDLINYRGTLDRSIARIVEANRDLLDPCADAAR